MNQFYLDIEASSSYGATAPTLEVLVDGIIVGSASINSSGTFSFLLDYPSIDTFPSALSLRFNDGSAEGGRTITITNIRVNGQLVDGSSISQSVLNQNDSSILDTSAEDHLFGRVEPLPMDLGTATISGTNGADVLHATNGDDIIEGRNGADYIRGVSGDDAIDGGIGADTIYGEDGNDIILGGMDDDLLFGNNGNDLIFGEGGNDRLIGGNGNDVLNGGLGNDLLMGGSDDDILYGEDGVDRLIGQNGDDILYGDAGADTLAGGNGNDALYGGTGDDFIIAGKGNDTAFGGADNDFILGNDGADTLSGDAGNDYIYGGNGNDVINGGADNDALHGDAGNDTLNGDAGADTLIGGLGSDTLNGGTGNDILHGHGLDSAAVSAILNANPNISYSEGTNSFYQLISASVTLAGAQGVAGASTLNGVSGHLVTITSQAENDFVDTLAAGNEIWLNGSDSAVEGEWRWAGGNEDNLMFWNGDSSGSLQNGFYENWNAGEPNDSAGEDGVTMRADGTWNDVDVTSTNFYVIEWDGANFSDDNAADTLNGGDGNDYLNGHGGNDILSGGNDVDHIVGGGGNDTLNGDAGNDYLYDNAGANTFNGGTGDDVLDARFQTAVTSIADQVATILAENAGVSYSIDTGNFYEVVSNQVEWTAARINASNMTFNGIGGHLATITTQEEHDFIVGLAIGQNTWLGGSDDPSITGGAYDDWYWVEGPEAGTHFSTGETAEAGQFTDWNTGQPNDTNDTQNYLYLLNANNGWADLVIEADGSTGFVTIPQYLVEWEGADVLFAPPTEISQGFNTMNGGAGDDLIYGGNNNDIINGDADNDTIYGYAGDDTINGGTGTDEIYGGVGSDTISGGSGNDTLYAAYASGASTIPLNVDFSAGTDGFAYTDGGFGGSDPGSVSVTGAYITTDGNTANGALEVDINMTNNNNVSNASGSWDITVNLATALSNAELSFAYRLYNDGRTDGGENTFAYVEVDGTQYGTGGNNWVDSLNGAGGNIDQDTGWVTVNLNVGALSAGNHTISIGALINAANRNNEDSWMRIDDVMLSNNGSTTDDSSHTNIINGDGGNDIIYGSNGTDTLNGGDGNDTIYSMSSAAGAVGSTSTLITTGNDDAEQRGDTSMYLNSSDLEMVMDGGDQQLVGLRWQNLDLEQGVTITNAYIEFQADESDTVASTLTFHGEDIDSASGFTSTADDIGSRTQTTASVDWSSAPSWTAGNFYQTPDLSAIIQEIVDRGGWTSGTSDLVIMVSGTAGSARVAESFGNGGTAARLVVEYAGIPGSTTILNGGDGLDDLYGGEGSDHFVFENASAFNDIDLINGFDINDNDALDISDILSSAGYNSATDAITDYLQITNSGSDSDVRVDVTGSASFGVATQIANIIGVTGLTDETTLEANGVIIT